MTPRLKRLELAALAALTMGAAPAMPPVSACGVYGDPVAGLDLDPTETASGLSMAPQPHGSGEPAAMALEVVGEADQSPVVQIRFAAPSAISKRWGWLLGTSAVLGPGSGPSITRLAGDVPSWLLVMSRIEGEASRLVAVHVRADEKARRLELESLVLDAADHVSCPTVLAREAGGLMIWGESSGALDRIVQLDWPTGQKDSPVTLATGSIDPRFAARVEPQGLLLAWSICPSEGSEARELVLGRFDSGGSILQGPVTAATNDTTMRILDVSSGSGKVVVQLLAGDPVLLEPVEVTAGEDLTDAQRKDWNGPELVPGTAAAGVIFDEGPSFLLWPGTVEGSDALAGFSGSGVWAVSARPAMAPVCAARTKEALLVAWTRQEEDRQAIELAQVQLIDLDADTVPDGLDLCPTTPETMDGRMDADGCPDPLAQVVDLLHDHVWFPLHAGQIPCTGMGASARSANGELLAGTILPGSSMVRTAGGKWHRLEDLPGPVTGAVDLPQGGFVVLAAGKPYHVDPGLSVVPLDVPQDEKAGPARPSAIVRLGQGRIGIVTDKGCAVLSAADLSLVKWLAPGTALVAAHEDPSLGTLLLTTSGRVLALDGEGEVLESIPRPAGTKDQTPVGLVVASGVVMAAWSGSGLYSLARLDAKWVKEHLADTADPAGGVASLAVTGAGQVHAVTASGALFTGSAGSWAQDSSGLEGTWVERVFIDGRGEALLVGSDGRPRLLARMSVDERVAIDVTHLSKSGAKAKDSIAQPLASALEKLLGGGQAVRIEGYSDPSGPSDKNLALSLVRAMAVASWLQARGVHPDLIRVIGFGELGQEKAGAAAVAGSRVEVLLLVP